MAKFGRDPLVYQMEKYAILTPKVQRIIYGVTLPMNIVVYIHGDDNAIYTYMFT